MKIDFVKMNGAGNDFIMIDNRNGLIGLSRSQIAKLCNRRRGIGADGLITIESSSEYDFHMRYFNSDGGEVEMCGNGARCVGMFAANLGLGKEEDHVRTISFSTKSGVARATIRQDRVIVDLGEARELNLEMPIHVENLDETAHFIKVGVPHAVILRDDVFSLEDQHVETFGRAIRNHEKFGPEGVNVDFASIGKDGTVHIRTYERGVEGETLACGTGSAAAAVVLAHLSLLRSPVRLLTKGRDTLEIAFEKTEYGAKNLTLAGPAEINFSGTIELEGERKC